MEYTYTLDKNEPSFNTLNLFYKGFKNLLDKEFPECYVTSFSTFNKEKERMFRGYHLLGSKPNTYQIRKFAEKYPYFDGMIGCIATGYVKHDLKELVVVPDYILLKDEDNNQEGIDKLLVLFKMEGYL